MANAGFVAALDVHDRLKKSTEIPLFYGDSKKDTILPSVLIERVERARRSANWTEERTCDEFLACLRDTAIHWHKGFKILRINDRVWQEIKTYFLETYEPKFSARMTCTNFQDLKQAPGEKVHKFFDRCYLVLERMGEVRPAAMNNVRRAQAPLPVVPAPGADQAALDAAAAHNVNAMTQAQNDAANKLEGLEDAHEFFMRQLFIAGLRDSIRSEVMKAGHEGLQDTLNVARETETVLEDVEKRTQKVTAIHRDEEDDDENLSQMGDLDEDELEAINQIRTRNGKPPFRRGFRKNWVPKNRTKTTIICRFCKKPGHMQKECHTRLRSGAAMVDQHGKPFKKVNQVDCTEATTHPTDGPTTQVDSVAKLINTLNW